MEYQTAQIYKIKLRSTMEGQLRYEICDPESRGKGGAYGVVKKAKDTKNGEVCAIKFLKYGFTEHGITPSTLREISILKELNEHPNIIKLRDTLFRQGYFYLVFDFRQMNLKEFMESTQLTPQTIRKILQQILQGVKFAHSRHILHRDIKPENILVSYSEGNTSSTESIKVEIADWGLSRVFFGCNQVYTKEVVTLPYRAPELLLGVKNYSPAIDIWSVGCVFGELLLGERIFNCLTELEQLEAILTTIDLPSKQQWPLLHKALKSKEFQILQSKSNRLQDRFSKFGQQTLDLLKMLLQLNPERRISASKALEHSYFKKQL